MELEIETAEADLRSLREWLAAEDGVRPAWLRWAPAEVPPGQMGAVSDVLLVALGAGGAGTVVARSIATWIRHRTSDVKVKITAGDRVIELDAQRVKDTAEIVRMISEVLPPDELR
ncbi:effector-associated constant component EACC1 [Saccharothrix deserti]|uniref:effector-associated constant component EACC1 n=1 Tax=Saccharothrix deserti TaxID=2593674 RepID=UPI00131C98C5|nr:hypothetical protein [Saccharothrix deserti]